MAGVDRQPIPHLTSTQQDLLLTALSSNKPKNGIDRVHLDQRSSAAPQNNMHAQPAATMDGDLFISPQQASNLGSLDSLDVDGSAYLDYLDGDTSFDFDTTDLDGQDMIGPLHNGNERHEKRKNSDLEDDDEEFGDPKRKEGEDKQAKKPGRKPIMAEPTTVRLTPGDAYCRVPY